MSSEDIPRIPKRPQRVHRPNDVNEPIQTRSLSSSSVDKTSLSDSGPESPQIPVNRPQRLKTKSPTPVGESDSSPDVEVPPVPSTRPNRAITDEESNKSDSIDDESPRPPVNRPQRVRTTSPMPSAAIAGHLSKANTADAIGGLGAPSMPLNRPVKRTTTESLDRLVQNTSVQLKEMEQLISKHNERAAELGDVDAQRDGSSKEGLLAEEDKDERESIKEVSGEHRLNTQEDEQVEKQHKDQPAQAVSNGIESSEADSVHGRGPPEEVSEKQESLEGPVLNPLSNEDDKILISANESEPVNEQMKEQSETPSDTVKSSPDSAPNMPRRPIRTGPSMLPANDLPKSDTQTPEPQLKTDDSSGSETSITKKRAPPVPKKPSSRIAAFQEMLQKKQLEQLQGPKPQHTLKQEVAESQRSKHGDEKAQFRQNLNALFTIPGAPAPAGVATTPSEIPTGESTNEDKKEKTLPDVRQKRARGPRGRKLPSKVATVEKVRNESTGNNIELFHSWTTIPRTRKEDEEDTIVKEEAVQLPSAGQDSSANDGIEERRSSVVQSPSGQKTETPEHSINQTEASLSELAEELESEHSGSIPATNEKEGEMEEVGPEAIESPQDSISKQISKDEIPPEFRTSKEISEDWITGDIDLTEK
ncbi:Aim21p TDEL_0H03200 [Torulaspora delbrueckii]|uniref:Altered inheritance of mitochondria protein 21 n=1 Tax=Torulaspora delbrueckii TaxID=4950 RepID=G8ZZY5_TORDE|nr:hypothetical protein TDEL_0H03200 [Torulaspora delbrueckii]CCE94179.1 hypothetical protein TDEL_0H03200 [Torulaspora delbrueckii]